MNSDVEPNFKEKFVEICTCKSCKQCMESIEKTQTQIFFLFIAIQIQPQGLFGLGKINTQY